MALTAGIAVASGTHVAPRANRRTRGTTILEALSATAITAALLAVGVPNFRRLGMPWALHAATRQVATDLVAARLRAIARNVRYRVTFDQPHGRYTLERETTPNAFTPDGAPQLLPAGVALGVIAPGNPIFDTRGLLTSTLTVPITSSAGAHTVTMNVLGYTSID